MSWLYLHGGKRLVDVVLAVTGGFFFLLPMAWIAWRIWREGGRPILFRQIRVGRGGRTFLLWKFRTMASDGKITKFSQRLRDAALDELPQLVNILKGQMSFVGPRPLIPEELQELDCHPEGRRRLWVRPGLTGLAQLASSKFPSLAERLQWDCAYVERCSPWLDGRILVESIGVTLRGQWEKPGTKKLTGGLLL